MTSFRKNLMVGVTAVFALALLAWMILRFNDVLIQPFAATQTPIELVTDNAEGISGGSPVIYRGMNVGRITSLERSPNNRQIILHADVQNDPPLPGNLEGRVRSQLIGGGGSVHLVLIPPAATQPLPEGELHLPAEPQGRLKPHQRLRTEFVGLEILPQEFTELAAELRLTAREVRLIGAEVRDEKIVAELANTVRSLRATADRAGVLFDGANKLLADETLRKNVHDTAENLRKVSETAMAIGQDLQKLSATANNRLNQLADSGDKFIADAQVRVDEIARSTGQRLVQVARILDNLESMSRKMDEGKGAVGKLINDPQLYQNLLDSSKELSLMMADLRRLIEQWEKEGVYLKLNK